MSGSIVVRGSPLLALLAMVACTASGCGGSAGGAQSAGSAGSSGLAGSAGTGGSAGSGACDPAQQFQCVPKLCAGANVVMSDCDQGEWKCAYGWVPVDQCPPDACFDPPTYVCCNGSGAGVLPTCPGHGNPVCPPGTYFTIANGAACPPAGQFPCGPTTCALGKQYCRWASGTATCQSLPAACGASPDCACLAGESCTCTDFGIGALDCAAS